MTITFNDIRLVSTASDGTQGNNSSAGPFVSANGDFVAFYAGASNLVTGDTNNTIDVFRKDVSGGTTIRTSVASDSSQANGSSDSVGITADGRYVLFESLGNNLVANDTNNNNDLFLHDTQTGITTRISTNSDGSQLLNGSGTLDSDMTPDGRYVVFSDSTLSNLYLKDLQTGLLTQLVTHRGLPFHPHISADSNYVTFDSLTTDPVSGRGQVDVFVMNLQFSTVTLVSSAGDGSQGNDSSLVPTISADGRYVAFMSYATNLVANDTNGHIDVFVKDLVTGVTTLVSEAGGIQGNGDCQDPAISPDGRYVAFTSTATNLVAGDANGNAGDIFVRDMQTGTIMRVSSNADGGGGNLFSANPYSLFSPDGLYLAFDSNATNLLDPSGTDTNNSGDVFLVRMPSQPPMHSGSVVAIDAPVTGGGSIDVVWGDGATESRPVPAGAAFANLSHDYVIDGQWTATVTGATAETYRVTIETSSGGVHNGASGQDIMILSAFDDTVFGGGGDDTLVGRDGNDILYGNDGAGVDTLDGGPGNDWYFVDDDIVVDPIGSGTADRVFAVSDYTLPLAAEIEILSTTDHQGVDGIHLTGNNFANLIYGNAGNNTLDGGGGNDTLEGFDGNDTLNGGPGDDVLIGDAGADELNGGSGNDIMFGGAGIDSYFGDIGNDWYFVDDTGETIVENPGAGTLDRVFASVSYTLSDGAEVEVMSTADHTGTAAIDLTGNEFVDTIYGNDGDNVLNGKAGSDVLIGRLGADTFVFDTALGPDNIDTILDFTPADDTIGLDSAVFTALSAGVLAANAFVTGSAALTTDQRIIYDNTNGHLLYDADGSANGSAAVQFATLSPGLTLTNADFLVT